MVVQYQKQKAQLSKMAKLKSVNLYQQKSVIVTVVVAAVLALVNNIKSGSIRSVYIAGRFEIFC